MSERQAKKVNRAVRKGLREAKLTPDMIGAAIVETALGWLRPRPWYVPRWLWSKLVYFVLPGLPPEG
jgi:hypothetical protein